VLEIRSLKPKIYHVPGRGVNVPSEAARPTKTFEATFSRELSERACERVEAGGGAVSVTMVVAEAGGGAGGARRRQGRRRLTGRRINKGGGAGLPIELGVQGLGQRRGRNSSELF
jgi:hypothetical protein